MLGGGELLVSQGDVLGPQVRVRRPQQGLPVQLRLGGDGATIANKEVSRRADGVRIFRNAAQTIGVSGTVRQNYEWQTGRPDMKVGAFVQINHRGELISGRTTLVA